MTSITLDDCKTRLLARLEQAGPRGLSRGGLGITGGSGPAARRWRQALAELERERTVGNLGTRYRSRYVLYRYYQPLELACAHLEGKATVGKPVLFSPLELGKGLCGPMAAERDRAIERLCREHKLIFLKRGNARLYLHTASLPSGILAVSPAAPPEASLQGLDREVVLQAYRKVVQETEFADVLIADLHQQLDVSLEAFKAWLVAECRAGRAIPSLGDWSLSSETARQAAIPIRNRPHLRIQLLD